jgi:hypothetical protein
MAARVMKLVGWPRRRTLLKALQEEIKSHAAPVGDRHISIRNNLTSKWSAKNRPRFTRVGPKNIRNGVSLKIKMRAQEANQAGISVWTLLDRGTAERKVRLVGWQSKTTPRSLVSGSGSGYVVRKADGSPVIFPPVKGIDEREFDDTANEELKPDMDKATDEAIKAAMSKVIK